MLSLEIYNGTEGEDDKRDQYDRNDTVHINGSAVDHGIQIVILQHLIMGVHWNIFICQEPNDVVEDLRVTELLTEGIRRNKISASDQKKVTVNVNVVLNGFSG